MSYLLTVSGLRGVVGKDLTPEVALRYAAALATLYGPDKIYVVGQDTRPHGHIFKNAVVAGMTGVGAELIDIGVVPTPTLLLTVRNIEYHSGGGIVITASHNPIEWNALKFVNPDGVFLFEKDVELLDEIARGHAIKWADWADVGSVDIYSRAIDDHIDHIVRTTAEEGLVDLETIMDSELRVAVDAVNGANWMALPTFISSLEFNPIKLNCEPTGIFPHPPEPRKENLVELDALLQSKIVDIGFATDPDGDRLLVGVKKKGLLTEEHTVALAAWAVLERQKGPIVVNYSTSMMIEDVARHFNVPVYRTKVGEANVLQKMLEYNAIVGGEGNGGVIMPFINPTRDSLVGTIFILDLAARGVIYDVLNHLGNYTMIKTKVPRRGEFNPEAIIEMFPNAVDSNTEDGAYIRFDDAWLQIRPSNTEPIIRIYLEARNEKRANELWRKAKKALQKAS